MIKLQYFTSVRDNTPRTLTIEVLRQLIRQPSVQQNVHRFRQTGDDQWKRRLPGITWQATYPHGVRSNTGAQPTGLFMLDVDHISKCHPLQSVREAVNTPLQMWTETVRGREDELDIVCCHGTPSGDGLRIVALCQPGMNTLQQNQQWLAGRLGTPYDTVCHDWARLSFISIPEDWYYLDAETLFDQPPVTDNLSPIT